jgi:hypothetical protein
MLLLDETVRAMQALDTEPEILTNACKRILGINAKPKPSPHSAEAVHDLAIAIANLTNEHATPTGIEALCMVLGTTVAVTARRGLEGDALKVVLSCVAAYYDQSRSAVLMERFKTDPSAAVDDFLSLIQQMKDEN